MDEERMILVGDESDILHCGYTHALSESGRRYPSAEHYAYAQTLRQIGVDDAGILELLATPSADVTVKAMQLIRLNMPIGHDMDSLSGYISACRDHFTLQGLKLRYKEDAMFAHALMETGDALLMVCDDRDSEFGVGMNEQAFLDWMKSENVVVSMLSYCMRNDRARPPALGKNRLGILLMLLRYQVRAELKAEKLRSPVVTVEGISRGAQFKVSEMVVALDGIFRPLSNLYALPFAMKGDRYRSVEHYAYQRLFDALDFDDKCVEKLKTTADPAKVSQVAQRVIDEWCSNNEDSMTIVEQKMTKLARWRQSAMKHKVAEHALLKKLLICTGDALIIETSGIDHEWSCGYDEREIQHLLCKPYIQPMQLVGWMTRREKAPRAVAQIGENKTGLLLMELREKLRRTDDISSMPFISPITHNAIRSMMSKHMICFTPESIFHPLYPAEIKQLPESTPLPTPMHLICDQTARYFGCTAGDIEWMLEPSSGAETMVRMYELLADRHPSLDRLYQWEYSDRQSAVKLALRLFFEQHSPLMRTLLDTGDALLVYCQRFSSRDPEWSIGMRERDLRAWCQHLKIDTKELVELCSRPLAERPPFLGGNRLGLILMELRRDFVLRGVFPQHLPELSIPLDAILGTDSPAENWDPTQPFEPMSISNYRTLWANPYLLLAKRNATAPPTSELGEMWLQANSVKTPPVFIPINDPKPFVVQQQLLPPVVLNNNNIESDSSSAVTITAAPTTNTANGFGSGGALIDANNDLDTMDVADMRSIFVKLATHVRELLTTSKQQHNEMDYLQSEIERVRRTRRELEDRRRKRSESTTDVGVDRMLPPPFATKRTSDQTSISVSPIKITRPSHTTESMLTTTTSSWAVRPSDQHGASALRIRSQQEQSAPPPVKCRTPPPSSTNILSRVISSTTASTPSNTDVVTTVDDELSEGEIVSD